MVLTDDGSWYSNESSCSEEAVRDARAALTADGRAEERTARADRGMQGDTKSSASEVRSWAAVGVARGVAAALRRPRVDFWKQRVG